MRALRAVLVKVFILASLVLGTLTVFAGPAAADNSGPQNPNPLSGTQYGPPAWVSLWDNNSDARESLSSLTAEAAMEKMGILVDVDQVEWKAMTTADQAQLTTAWKDNLATKVWNRASTWQSRAWQTLANAPSGTTPSYPGWAQADSDAVAKDLGSTDYASLSPGLKGVVQRVATIVSGDTKPPMPDTDWSAWMTPDIKQKFDSVVDQKIDWAHEEPAGATSGAHDTTDECDAGWLNWACHATQAVAGTIAAVASFADDPLGWLTEKVGEGAQGILTWMANTANSATAPDLSSAWWISAYEKGMAIGILLFGIILVYQIWEKARGRIDAQEFLELFSYRVPGFFAGLVFGPPLGQFLLQGSGYLSDDIIKNWLGSDSATGMANISEAAKSASTGQVLGGMFVALVFLICVLLCGVLVFISLAVQAVTIYLSSAVFGIAFAWFISATHRGGSLKIPFLFLGICFSRPLLFFMLGLGEGVVGKAMSPDTDSLTKTLAQLIMAVVVFALAGFAPLLMLKFAPVIPTGMTGATSHSVSGAPSGRAGAGSRLQQLAARRLPGQNAGASSGAVAGGVAAAGQAARGGAATAATAGAAGSAVGGAAAAVGGAAGAVGAAGAGSSVTSRAARAGGGSAASLTGQLLGRSRRHGGGVPSAGAAHVAAARPRSIAGRTARAAGRGAVRSMPGAAVGVAASASRTAESMADGVGGDREW